MLLHVVEAIGWASILLEVLTQRLVYVLDVASRVLMGLWKSFRQQLDQKMLHTWYSEQVCVFDFSSFGKKKKEG